MNKLISKIVGVALGLTLAAGTGVAIAANGKNPSAAYADVDTTFSGSSITFSSVSGIENGVQYTDWSGDEFSIKFGDGANDGKYYTTGTGMRVYGGGYVQITPASGRTMTKIEMTFSGTGNMPATNAYTLSDNSSLTFNSAKATWSGSTTSAIKLTRGSGSGHWRLQTIVVTSTGSGQATVSSVSVTGDMTKKAYTTVDTWDNGGLTANVTMTSGSYSGTVDWAYSPTSPAAYTISNDGEVTSGTVRATASAGGKSGYKDVTGISVTYATVAEVTAIFKSFLLFMLNLLYLKLVWHWAKML